MTLFYCPNNFYMLICSTCKCNGLFYIHLWLLFGSNPIVLVTSDIKHLFIDWDKNVIVFYCNIIKLCCSLSAFKYIGSSWALLVYKPITVLTYLIVITFNKTHYYQLGNNSTTDMIHSFIFTLIPWPMWRTCIVWMRNNCLILWSTLYW